jgi:hypothetical protein
MPLCTPEAVGGPTADVLEGAYIRIDKIALLTLSLSLHWRARPTRQSSSTSRPSPSIDSLSLIWRSQPSLRPSPSPAPSHTGRLADADVHNASGSPSLHSGDGRRSKRPATGAGACSQRSPAAGGARSWDWSSPRPATGARARRSKLTGGRLPPSQSLSLNLTGRDWEVEEDRDVWVPHVSETREGMSKGNLVHTNIDPL